MASGPSAPWLEREHNYCALSAKPLQNHCQARPQSSLTTCKQKTQPKPSLSFRSSFQHRNTLAHVCLASGSRGMAKYSLAGNYACGKKPPTPVLTPTAWQTLLEAEQMCKATRQVQPNQSRKGRGLCTSGSWLPDLANTAAMWMRRGYTGL